MLKTLLCAVLLLCCANCKADEAHISLVITLDPGESVMIKSADGEHSTFIDYKALEKKPVNFNEKGLSFEESYHLEYHLIIWAQCPSCTSFYNAAEGGCRNPYCPAKVS
jgi:hypothetical protein